MKRKILTLLATMMSFIVLTVTVSASGTCSITIKSSTSGVSVAGKTFTAYQLFSVTTSGDQNQNVAYEFANDSVQEWMRVYFKDENLVAYQAVEKINGLTETLDMFANDVMNAIKSDELSLEGKQSIESDGNVVIQGLQPGYYLIYETTTNQSIYSASILATTMGDHNVNLKAEIPTMDKKVDGQDKITASVGDEVTFTLTSKVPDMTGYNKYYFIVRDTMTEGLAYKTDSMVITLGDATLSEGNDYYIEQVQEDGKVKLKIVFNDFIQYKQQKGESIVITYMATVTDSIINIGNATNTADIVYSNNPNYDYEGNTPNTGNPNDPTNPNWPEDKKPPLEESEESIVTVYSFYFDLIKVDQDKKPLSGATFVIYDQDPTQNSNLEILGEGTSGDDGKVTFIKNGQKVALKAGTYYIVETQAPDGYNKLTKPIVITITESGGFEATIDGQPKEIVKGTITFNVENRTGTLLPETGGMGTKIFMIVGASLMLGSAVLLVTKKIVQEKK